MNSLLVFELPISESAIERLGWALVHSFWQFAVVALVAAVVVRARRWRAAEVRYGVLVGAMGVAVAAPVVTWTVLPGSQRADSRSAATFELDPVAEVPTHRRADATPLTGNEVIGAGQVVD